MIATHTIDAALRGIGEDIFFERSLANFFCYAGFFREGLPIGFVFYELDALQEPKSANLPDIRMIFDRCECISKSLGGRSNAIEKFVRFEIIEHGVAGRGCNRMRLIGEAVHECGASLLKSVDDPGRDQDGTERRVAAGDSFADEDDVWLEIPVLRGKRLAGAAHAAHDFIGDKKNAVFAADFRDAGGVAVDSGSGTEGGAHDGLEDECRYARGIVGGEECVQIISAGEIAFGIRFVERAVIAKARSDVAPFWNHGRVGSATRDISTDRHRAKSAAVVALFARDNAITSRLFELKKILAGKFQCSFRRFGTAGSEINPSTTLKITWSEGQDTSSEVFGGLTMKLRSVRKGNLIGLGSHGVANLLNAVTNVDNGGLAGSVEIAPASRIDNPATFTADGDGILPAEIAREQRRSRSGRTHKQIVAEGASAEIAGARQERAKLAAIGAIVCDTLSRIRRS